MKELEKMKKSELQALAAEKGVMYGSKTTAAELIKALEQKIGSNGKQTGTFKMLKTEYAERADARVAKNFPTVSGELKVLREIDWEDERNTKNESLIFFKVGDHPEECLIFSGAMVAAANKAGIELFSEIDGALYLNQGFNVSLKPRQFAFDTE